MHPTSGARYVMDECLKNIVLTSRVDNGTDMDAPCSTNLYIVRLPSFRRQELADWSSTSVNKSLKGKWASLACHETGSLVVQVGQ